MIVKFSHDSINFDSFMVLVWSQGRLKNGWDLLVFLKKIVGFLYFKYNRFFIIVKLIYFEEFSYKEKSRFILN